MQATDNMEVFLEKFLDGKGNHEFIYISNMFMSQCCHLAKFSNLRNVFQGDGQSNVRSWNAHKCYYSVSLICYPVPFLFSPGPLWGLHAKAYCLRNILTRS